VTGHAIADLEGADAELVFHEAIARGVELMPLSAYCFDRACRRQTALVLGFAAVRPELFDAGFERLAAAIDAARRSGRARTGSRGQGWACAVTSRPERLCRIESTISHQRPDASRFQGEGKLPTPAFGAVISNAP
jgi:hypothetical protein